MTETRSTTATEPGALRVEEAARWLGLSPTVIRELLKTGELRGARVGPGGGRLVVPLAELRRYLDAHTTEAAS